MSFKVGDKVVYLQERGGGVVVNVQGSYFIVEDEETGFKRRFEKIELAPVFSENYDNNLPSEESEFEEPQEHSYLTKSKVSGRRKPEEVWEVDLHVEELVESHSNLSNTEILRKQMSALKNTIKDARKKNVGRVIAIHGKGEGVLKSEITTYLAQQEGVEFFDADFREYGKGATEIRLFNID